MVVYTHCPLPGTRVKAALTRFLLHFPTGARLLRAPLVVAAVACAAPLAAAPVNPYEITLAGEANDHSRTALAGEALRQVAVRASGRRSAASDPGLAALFGSAREYVSTLTAAGPGRVRIGFDAATVESALARAGLPIWDRDRPTTLVVFAAEPAADAAVLAEWRRALDRVAQNRGLQLAWPTGESAERLAPRVDAAQRGEPGLLLDLAKRYGAEEVLFVTRSAGAAEPGVAAFGRIALPKLGAHPDEALQVLADRLAADASQGANQALATLTVDVHGIGDVRAYAAARRLLEGLSPVRAVTLTDAGGDVARFAVSLRGGPDALKRALEGAEHLTVDPTATAPGAALALKLAP